MPCLLRKLGNLGVVWKIFFNLVPKVEQRANKIKIQEFRLIELTEDLRG